MPSFPKLKTGAVAQYPATKSLRFHNQTLRFVDGTEQRYRDCAAPLHRWEIRLDQIDEGELAAMAQFFLDVQGAFGQFAFTDPWDGHEYENCSLDVDLLDLHTLAEMRGSTRVAVVENR
jgi:hypothetical protein